ncbi:MAG: thioredoxin-disulfide reductase [Alkalibacterium gilvum]|uniref:Thioredoxin reductase n=1 Tax=Alkalibacterium gilvum TaxID=1130080 RepID=A0A1H6SQK3_9LACT|nr:MULTISPECIES: thioredoxin-disulfide reductase [Alkalibacterium]MDN6293027.1 thioredoxin-disulfide reductase [Alkalibacterium sp.]MDN6294952.1 thioredoxin-disulfide reductase [Alkalibacterium sp.]MDN6730244.1 thioredoxin-disulfide reductase [Alkalibacterium sp.]SEI70133.1 thioredoxin reductase (NADPH) [Alkalibacterium gilvum]
MEENKTIYDVIIIGAGPGGLTAALYASRSNLKTLILEKGIPGGQLNNTAEIENYSGFKSVTGPDLSMKMLEGATQFGAEHVYGDVREIADKETVKEVITSDKTYQTRSVIIATGAEHKKLGVKGEAEFNGRGVSYCAVCDGAFFRNKEIIVVGGGDSAVEEGAYLTQFADKVTIIHRRDELRAQKILQDRAYKNKKIDFIWDTVVEEIVGEESVTGVEVKNVKNGETSLVRTDGAFIYIGLLPNSESFMSLPITNEEGWIETDANMMTQIPGIFAVGDVRETVLRQVATAVGDGSIAGNAAYQYVEELKEAMEK